MPRLTTTVLVLLLASGARAEEPQLVVRQLVGISFSASDSGIGLGAQLGVRLSSLLLRVTFDVGGGTGPRGYFARTVRGDWLHPITEDSSSESASASSGMVSSSTIRQRTWPCSRLGSESCSGGTGGSAASPRD